jgi:hypothetical protein
MHSINESCKAGRQADWSLRGKLIQKTGWQFKLPECYWTEKMLGGLLILLLFNLWSFFGITTTWYQQNQESARQWLIHKQLCELPPIGRGEDGPISLHPQHSCSSWLLLWETPSPDSPTLCRMITVSTINWTMTHTRPQVFSFPFSLLLPLSVLLCCPN